MTLVGWLQIALYAIVLTLITKPMGMYLASVFGPVPQEGSRGRTFLDPVIRPVENLIYRLCRINPDREQTWIQYAISVSVFTAVGAVATYLVERTQQWLPLNPQGLINVPEHLSFNTAVSFATNTNWQSYYPEVTMSYFTQMTQLAMHNFWSAGIGIVVAVALTRGIARRRVNAIGNFWVDLIRVSLYVLLPICLMYAVFLISQGAIDNFASYVTVHTLEGGVQGLPMGPLASQEAIKMLGTNGGGFLNANSAHPFENPTPLSNFVQMLSIFLIPAGLIYMFGLMAGSRKQGWTLYGAVLILFLAVTSWIYAAEGHGNLNFKGVNQTAVDFGAQAQAGGNMEGKEVRFGIADSALFASITTAASCGAVNAMHESFTAIGGLGPLFNIAVGELIFGGVGSGLYDLLIFVIVTVFLAGLMVGRTPEFLGKKIEAKEMKLAMLAIVALEGVVLLLTAVSLVKTDALASLWAHGPHGLTEMLYAFTSAAGNNGSAFAGINANVPFLDTALGFTMLIGRYFMIIPTLAIAGALGRKQEVPQTAGTFPTTGLLFGGLLIASIIIVAALTFFPAWSLGPIVEQLMPLGRQF